MLNEKNFSIFTVVKAKKNNMEPTIEYLRLKFINRLNSELELENPFEKSIGNNNKLIALNFIKKMGIEVPNLNHLIREAYLSNDMATYLYDKLSVQINSSYA